MSRFGVVESSCLAKLQTVAGLNETKAIAPSVATIARPEQYPAAWLIIEDPEQPEKPIQSGGHTQYVYDIIASIVIFANSDGQTQGDSRFSAWTLMDAVMDAFSNFQPTGFVTETSIWPMTMGIPKNSFTDAGLSCLLLPMRARISWWV